MQVSETDADNKDSFFHGGHWGQCLELLTHLCQYSDSILMVIGPKGIGKTSLKQALVTNNEDKFVHCELQARTDLTTAEAIDFIDRGFEAALEVQSAGIDENPDLLLLVDDAHKMPLQVISVLLQLKQTINVPGNLHIVLFAQPEFEQLVQKSPFRDKFSEQVHTIELEPLTLNEVQNFLSHQKHEEIDKALCKKIYSLSGGVPGTVLQIANDILDGDQVRKVKTDIKRWSPFSVGLTVAFGVVFCLLAFMWPEAGDDVINIAEESSIELPVQSSNTNLDNQESIVSVADSNEQFADSEVTSQTTAAIDGTNVISGNIAQVGEMPATEPVNHETQAEQLLRLENKLIALQQQLDLEKAARNAAEKKAQEILAKASEYAKPRKVSKSKHSNKEVAINRHEKYILSLPTRNYTLQLLGSSNENKVKQFIAENRINADAHYYTSTRNGKPWFIVVYGNFPNLSTANQALKLLPPSLKKLNPWPREFSAIQNVINKKS